MPKTVRKGDTGSDVKYCQQLLTASGFPCSADGVFGTGTDKALRSFQSDANLVADGICGANTWSALERESALDVELPIDFQRVADLFPQMLPQKYKLSGAQCPSNPPGMSLRNIGDEWTNCVQFTAWLLAWAFEGVSFSKDQWSRWMVGGDLAGNPPIVPNWGPKVVIDWGVATSSPGNGAYLLQYFTSTGGHSLIVLAHDKQTDKILTLESVGGIDGAGWGQIGPLRNVINPGPNWMDKVTQTWASRIEPKVAVHMARLAICPDSIQKWLENGV